MTTDTSSTLQAARSRLDRLEGFLRADPGNATLLTDAFETALSCGEFMRAESLLTQGLATGTDPWAWHLKQGDLLLAQHRYDEAHDVLTALQQRADMPPQIGPVLVHNLSYIDLQRGAFKDSVQRLAALMEQGAENPVFDSTLTQALQTLWLRSLHRTGELDRAMAWAIATDAAGALKHQAAGVASQIALDANDLPKAQRWAQWASQQDQQPTLELLTTLASLALGQTDAEASRRWCSAALALQPQDGRTLSVLGFADMLTNDMPLAETRFRQSLQFMPEHVGTWHGLALTLVLQGRLDEAKTIYEKTLEMDRNFAESHGGLAVVLVLQQQPALAKESIERALRLDRQSVSAAYAQEFLKGGEPQKLQEKLQQVARTNFLRSHRLDS